MKSKRVIVFYKHKGEALVSVSLSPSGEQVATFDQADWEFLQRLGLSSTLSIGPHGYVRAPAFLAPGAHVSVARVLLDARNGQVVHFKDSDKLNLRRGNLSLRKGAAKNRDRSYLTPLDRARTAA